MCTYTFMHVQILHAYTSHETWPPTAAPGHGLPWARSQASSSRSQAQGRTALSPEQQWEAWAHVSCIYVVCIWFTCMNAHNIVFMSWKKESTLKGSHTWKHKPGARKLWNPVFTSALKMNIKDDTVLFPKYTRIVAEMVEYPVLPARCMMNTWLGNQLEELVIDNVSG